MATTSVTGKTSFELITLIDAESNKEYSINVSVENATRARSDLNFAYSLLQEAKINERERERPRNSYSNTNNITEDSEDVDDPEAAIHSANQNENICNAQHLWTRTETLLLIDSYKKEENNFIGGKVSIKRCWETVSKKMADHGYAISGAKCCTKFQALKRTYKNITDHNKKSGNNFKKWEFYEIMHDLFHKKPWIKPVATAGTSNDDENTEKENVETENRKRKSNRVEEYVNKSIEEKKLNREAANERHKEKMARLDKIENVLLQLLNK